MLFTSRVILVFFFFPAAGLFCYLSIPPRGIVSFHSEHFFPVIPSVAEESRGNERGG